MTEEILTVNGQNYKVLTYLPLTTDQRVNVAKQIAQPKITGGAGEPQK